MDSGRPVRGAQFPVLGGLGGVWPEEQSWVLCWHIVNDGLLRDFYKSHVDKQSRAPGSAHWGGGHLLSGVGCCLFCNSSLFPSRGIVDLFSQFVLAAVSPVALCLLSRQCLHIISVEEHQFELGSTHNFPLQVLVSPALCK